MAKNKKGEGFHSSAGLIRYFDAEEKSAIQIPPWFVIALSIATMIVVTTAHLTIHL
jgi:preprotein translocase subunit Sec61beta